MNRQSLYHSNLQQNSSNNQLLSIQSCAQSVQFSCQTLSSTIQTLSSATSDLPRLSSVLTSKKHFDLVSEAEIRNARDFLRDEMTPQVKELIMMAEKSLEGEEGKERLRKNKVSQLTARLDQLVASLPPSERDRARSYAKSLSTGNPIPAPSSNQMTSSTSAPSKQSILIEQEKARLKGLRARKEKLSKKVEDLEVEEERARTEAELIKKASSSRGSSGRMQ